jgi:glucose dehydrogenase
MDDARARHCRGRRLISPRRQDGRACQEFARPDRSIRGGTGATWTVESALPTAVYKNTIAENNGEQAPSFGLYGDIRGWDARTGTLLWSFHTVPRAREPGVETWEGDSWKNRSGTNMWAFFTIDEARGLVFAPTGSPTSDYYGATEGRSRQLPSP